MTTHKKLSPLRDVARELNVSKRHVQNMITSGQWPAYRAGKKLWRVDIEEFKKLARIERK
jgi:excisionase family DNA binding protein